MCFAGLVHTTKKFIDPQGQVNNQINTTAPDEQSESEVIAKKANPAFEWKHLHEQLA